MAKIVYLIGAGASAHALPIVYKIPEKLEEVINDLDKIKILTGISENDLEKIDYAVNDLVWLKNESSKHASIDTFAKKLYVKKKIEDLRRLKSSTGLFFSILQVKYKVDPRYDQFIASIIGDSVRDLPKEICVISWNYDNQFELAFKEYSENYDCEVQEAFLGMIHKNHLNNLEKDKFNIFKINGTSGCFTYGDGSKNNLLKRLDQKYDNNFLKRSVDNYIEICHSLEYPNFKPLMSFAWERNNSFDALITQLKSVISECQTLVIIGYSIPFFNRKIDKEILDTMENLRTIYIQDMFPDTIKQRLFQLIPISEQKSIRVEYSNDLNQFLIPYEL
ncbi:hypothetical protein ACFPIK_14160 [Algoriphagus aquatilis]|uniref:SIR2-like domain-containing protein n=1 Tax=Algoriphagus aquatilis TaxID=490186 RepID=A0ABW0BZD9_9BACT